jgi:RsbT co-antagonist protein rsbRD N-terminal domain
MIALRLVRLIEAHSDELAESLTHKVFSSERTRAMRAVPASELHARCHEIYQHLSDWILSKTETDIEKAYVALGARRARQGVSLAALTWALMLTKENLFEFLASQGMHGTAVSVFGELELLRSLDRFFDRAIYHATVGYEREVAASAA